MSKLSSQVEKFWVGCDSGSQHVGLSLFYEGELADFVRVSSYAKGGIARRSLVLAEKVDVELTRMLGFASAVENVHAIMELPGKQGGRQRAKSLIGIGVGVGAMNLLLSRRGFDMHYADVDLWSRLSSDGPCRSKEDRAKVIGAMYPRYRPEQDDGLDVADAIGIVAWKLGHFERNGKLVDSILGVSKTATAKRKRAKARVGGH